MEHRKRNRMQQKMELPTLLRIVIAKQKTNGFLNNETDSKNLVRVLAIEAMESLSNCDHTELVEQTIF